jgi:hypothetical protein
MKKWLNCVSSGFAVEYLGFRSAALMFIPLYALLFLLNSAELFYNIRKNSKAAE